MLLSQDRLYDAVAALRAAATGKAAADRRLMPRFRVWAPAMITPTVEGHGKPFEAWVLDLSRGGIGIVSPRRMENGREFHVTLPSLDRPPVHVRCRVVYCSAAAAGSYTIGAKFLLQMTAEPASPTDTLFPDRPPGASAA